MKIVISIGMLLLSISTASSADDFRSLSTRDIRSVLLEASKRDSQLGLTLSELEAHVGKYDGVTTNGVLKKRETLIYTLSNGRELQIVPEKNGDIWFAAVVTPKGAYELVWK